MLSTSTRITMWQMMERGANNAIGVVDGAMVNGVVGQGMIRVDDDKE